MKKKKHKIIFTIFATIVVSFALIWSCLSDDSFDFDTNKTQNIEVIEDAKQWYAQQNLGSEVLISLPKNETGRSAPLFFTEPSWDYYNVSQTGQRTVVDVDLTDRMGLAFVPKENYEKYQETQDFHYLRSFSRLVIVSDKGSREKIGFLMTIIPSVEYCTDFRKNIAKNTYMERDSKFDGLILYHNLQGEFVNGWQYVGGETIYKIETIRPDDVQATIEYSVIPVTYHILPSLRGMEDDGNWLPEVTVTPPSPNYPPYYPPPVYIPPRNDDNNTGGYGGDPGYGGGGSGGSSSNNNKNDNKGKEPEKRTDCGGSATTNANHAYAAINGSNDIRIVLNTLRTYANNEKVEWGTSIEYLGGEYKINRNRFVTGTSNSVDVFVNSTTVFTVHTHHTETADLPLGPSLSDVHHVMDIAKDRPNFKGEIVIGKGETQYLLYVNDRYDLQKFAQSGANISKDYYRQIHKNIETRLIELGYSERDAYDYALAHLLKEHKTGITLSKTANYAGRFKEMKMAKPNLVTYQPQICP